MNETAITCNNEQRRELVRKYRLNGLDYLEVSDDQRSLCVHFLGQVPTNVTKNNVRIEGGQRIRNIKVTRVDVESQDDPTLDGCLRVSVDQYGDFSTYTLYLVEADEQGHTKVDEWGQPIPLQGFDRHYVQLKFNFKVSCPSDLDCNTESVCPPEQRLEPEINYLAKDYASFRQLILDRLALIMPQWQERHIPDLGITLVELLAYVGDYLSYYQDAVATEAYLDTARQRISIRRHVQLVDYWMHEGCNARTWVWIEADTDLPPLDHPEEFFFITPYPGSPTKGSVLNQTDDLRNISTDQYEVFEPVTAQPIHLYIAHNEILFYTWGDRQCCLPQGSTTATLRDDWDWQSSTQTQPSGSKYKKPDPCDDPEPLQPPQRDRKLYLKPGDILIFEEVKGAKTGNSTDADPTHRHAVRLTKVIPREDPLHPYQSKDTTSQNPLDLPTPVLEIEWAVEDALPFPLCISALGSAPECCLVEDISVVRGNVILVDHGRTIHIHPPEDLGTVDKKPSVALCEGEGQPSDVITVPLPFYPTLDQAPLTFRQPLSAQDSTETPASKLLDQNLRQALPQIIQLIGFPPNYPLTDPQHPPDGQERWQWMPQPDLLSSDSQNQHYVVEMDNEGYAHLRFGDGELGRQPEVGTHFFATYRVGNGTAGNIGADTIAHIVFRQPVSGITLKPHNPFPARGGTPPEPLSEVKLFAPTAFRKELQRAITAQDYADIVMRDFSSQVQRAAATVRWTGSWQEVLVAIDPHNTGITSDQLLTAIEHHLYSYRRMGHDVVVKSATYVPLAIALKICVMPDYLRGHVKAALLEVFSNRQLPNGQLGFFHPDNLTFGTGIYLSTLVATAQSVQGVMSVQVTRLKRLEYVANPSKTPDSAESSSQEILNGILSLTPWEIAQLDNDPSFPENGILKLDIGGGR